VRRIATLAFVAAAVVASAAVALASPSPKAVRASILAAARTERSVHWSAKEIVGQVAIKTATDAARSGGVQTVTLGVVQKNGHERMGHVHIVVTGGVAYIRADALGLQMSLDLASAQAKKYAGRWISIPKVDPAYKPTAEGDTMNSVVHDLAPHGRLTLISAKSHGVRVIGVRGVSGSGAKKMAKVVIAHTKGKRLPLEEDILVPGKSALDHMLFSKWNETVKVTAPAKSTPISAVRAG
jgi:hypothetical protein